MTPNMGTSQRIPLVLLQGAGKDHLMLREKPASSSFCFSLFDLSIVYPSSLSTSMVMVVVAMNGKENSQEIKFYNEKLPLQLLKLGSKRWSQSLLLSLCPPITWP